MIISPDSVDQNLLRNSLNQRHLVKRPMMQQPNEDCFNITKPLIDQPFKSKLYWERSLLVASRHCPKRETVSGRPGQCQIQACTDAAFIQAIRQGEPKATIAWNNLYNLYAKDLYTWLIFKGCKDEATAQDIIHDVLLRFRYLVREKGLVLESATLKTYLHRSALNKWIDHTKKSVTKKELLPGQLPEPEPAPMPQHVFEKIRKFITLYRKAFPDADDNCLKLMKYFYLEKMSYKEILATKVGQQYGTENTLGKRVRNCTERTMSRMAEGNFRKELEDIFGQSRINPKWTGGEHGKA